VSKFIRNAWNEQEQADIQAIAREKILDLDASEIDDLSDEALLDVAHQLAEIEGQDRQNNQLLNYQFGNKGSLAVHQSTAQTCGVGGGNGSSKTETCLVEMIMCATGIFPYVLRDKIDPETKFKGPINCRVVCESLTTTLHSVILPKLRYESWDGVDRPGGKRGHWGWIPKHHLIDASWDKSWSEKLRTLRFLYRNWETGRVEGVSKIQFMSVDNDWSDFASGNFHIVLHDEPPTYAIWRENEARTMRVNGRMLLAMTWPDDPAIPVDWLFDEVYDPATRADKDPNIDWFVLDTHDNPHLEAKAVEVQEAKWSPAVAASRIHGQPIRFSNRVHPLFTDRDDAWCFQCEDKVFITEERVCTVCDSTHVAEYNHVQEFATHDNWPTIFLIDPHPRKPNMWMWVQVDPNDDYWVVDEGALDGESDMVRDKVWKVEEEHCLFIALRLIDPNMGLSRSNAGRREETWRDEFAAVGLDCELPSDSSVGQKTLNTYLRPDKRTHRPRVHVHPRCVNTIMQMKRYQWDEHRQSLEKDQKQVPRQKNDDYPTLLKYLMNEMPTFRMATQGPVVINNFMGGAR
jgi:hypothetical protein